MKRFAAVLIVILIAIPCAWAREGIVTWTWYENDPMVEYYRYQVDAEEPGMWTVVDWSVTEVSITLDVSVVHTLYLQQSYDGIMWSESSSTDSEVFAEEEPEPVEEEPVIEEEIPEEPEIREETEEPVEEAPVVEVGFIPLSQLDMGLCYMDFIPDSAGPRAIGATVSYSRTFAGAGVFGFGAKAGIAADVPQTVFSREGGSFLFVQMDVLGLVTARVGNCDVYMALGPAVCLAAGGGSWFSAGISAEIGVRYHRTEKLSFGLELADRQYLSDRAHIGNMMDIGAYVSLSI